MKADCYHELATVLQHQQQQHEENDATTATKSDTKHLEEAVSYYEKELAIRRQPDEKPHLFYQCLYSYADLLEHTGELEEAHRCYCEAFQHSKQVQIIILKLNWYLLIKRG